MSCGHSKTKRNFRPGGPPKSKGKLLNITFEKLFGVVIVRGTLLHNGNQVDTLCSIVRCLDGRSDDKTRTVWTDDGRFKVNQSDIPSQLNKLNGV